MEQGRGQPAYPFLPTTLERPLVVLSWCGMLNAESFFFLVLLSLNLKVQKGTRLHFCDFI